MKLAHDEIFKWCQFFLIFFCRSSERRNEKCTFFFLKGKNVKDNKSTYRICHATVTVTTCSSSSQIRTKQFEIEINIIWQLITLTYDNKMFDFERLSGKRKILKFLLPLVFWLRLRFWSEENLMTPLRKPNKRVSRFRKK